MNNKPESLIPKLLMNASVYGVALAVFGIIAFIALWMVLGSAGVSQTPRLFIALCVPPVLFAAIIGVLALVKRKDKQP